MKRPVENSAWSEVQRWLQNAKNAVEILAGDKEQGKVIFQRLQVSPRSLMGTLALETGGILLDHGWLRFLGAGNERMKGNLLSWNAIQEGFGIQQAFIVAHDVIGSQTKNLWYSTGNLMINFCLYSYNSADTVRFHWLNRKILLMNVMNVP